MNSLKLICFVGIIIQSVLSCDNSTQPVEQYSPFIGKFNGTYVVTKVRGIDSVVYKKSQWVNFNFLVETYQLRWDSIADSFPIVDTSTNNIRYFCDSDGNYTLLANGQVLFTVTNPDVSADGCKVSDNPTGSFDVGQYITDTLLFQQNFTDSSGNSVTRRLALGAISNK